ncbi:MAG TPA: hypothetical protein VGC42_02385 [Kofleriaceae bacterium]
MPTDPNALQSVLTLAQSCEDLARGALGVAQAQLRAQLISQAEFDQAFNDYSVAMQKARDLYYQASHNLAQQIAGDADIKKLTAETAALTKSVQHLQKIDHILTLSFGVVTLTAAIATAILTPGTATLEGAWTAFNTVKAAW